MTQVRNDRVAVETDYLVVGAGAVGMAFVDALVDAGDADVVMLDERPLPGGHWHDAYPFVRLHQPSANYGVNSTALGFDRIDQEGPNRGFHELAGAPEICAYYDGVMQHRLLPSGQVRFFPRSHYLGDGRFRSLVTGGETDVRVRRCVVDATYIASRVPATEPAPFEVAPDARCVPVGALAGMAEPPAGYVLIGSGKTAMDAVTWLLELGTPSDAITWVRPREPWMMNRANFQPGAGAIDTFAGVVHELEAVAASGTVDEAFLRIEEAGVMLRLDPERTATMCKGPTVSLAEAEGLRRIENVVRLGHVERIESDQIVLTRGTVPTTTNHLHVHCAARGIPLRIPLPIFSEGSIRLQSITRMSPSLSAAVTGFVESTDRSIAEKNALLPPNAYSDTPFDFLRAVLGGLRTEMGWLGAPDVQGWVDASRLNVLKDMAQHADSERLAELQRRFLEAAIPAYARIDEWGAAATTKERELIYHPAEAA